MPFSFFRPCSGLVVSGYSRRSTLPDMSWNKNLQKAISQYKNFKKMYIVDKYSAEYKGNKIL